MNNKIVFLIVLLLGSFFANSQNSVPEKDWSRVYGGTGFENVASIKSASNGDFVLAANTNSKGEGMFDAWIIKIDRNGYILWEKTLGSEKDDKANLVLQTNDKNYLVVGTTSANTNGETDFWLTKLKENGDVEWQKNYGGEQSDIAYSAVQTSDNGYAIVGTTTSYGAGKTDILLLKINAKGEKEWQKTFGNFGEDEAFSIIQTKDKGFAIAGYKTIDSLRNYDFWIIKTDDIGNIQWDNTFNNDKYNIASSILQSSDNNFVVLGTSTDPKKSGKNTTVIFKIDTIGNVLWNNTFDSFYSSSNLVLCSDGGYAFVSSHLGNNDREFYIHKVDKKGDLMWKKIVNSSEGGRVRSLIYLQKNEFIIAGSRVGDGMQKLDIWINKIK